MDELHQHILKKLRKDIVHDMDVHNGIIKPLRSEYILTEQQIAQIENGASKQQQAEILLDILPRYDIYMYEIKFLLRIIISFTFSCGPYAFDAFRQALSHHYEWLSEYMNKLEDCGKSFCDTKHMDTPTLPPISPLTVVRERKVRIYIIKALDIILADNCDIFLLYMHTYGNQSCKFGRKIITYTKVVILLILLSL